MRKLVTLLLLSALTAATSLATSPTANANNKISNGVACKKANATTVGKDKESYKCLKNPYYKKTSLTWTWVECTNANNSLKTFRDEHNALVAAGASATDAKSSKDFLDGWVEATKQACARGV